MADTSKSKVSSTTLMFEEEVVERRLAFKPDPELGNLCMGIINDVRIDIREVPLLDDKGVESTWEYAGCKFPVLVIEFKQCKTDANPKDRYYTFTAKPVTTLNKKGEPVEEKTVINIIQQVYGQLRHIANQFKGLKGYPVNAGKCPGLDYAAPAKVRCEQYLAFFEYFKHLLVGDDEKNPIYKNVKLFMKLVADYNTHKFLAFPSFVNRGFVERVIPGQSPSIEFEAGETIHLAKDDAPKNREAAAGAPAPAPGTCKGGNGGKTLLSPSFLGNAKIRLVGNTSRVGVQPSPPPGSEAAGRAAQVTLLIT